MIPLYLVECRLAKVALLPSKSEFLFYKLFCCLTGSHENCKDDLLLKMAFGILHCGDILKVRWAIFVHTYVEFLLNFVQQKLAKSTDF